MLEAPVDLKRQEGTLEGAALFGSKMQDLGAESQVSGSTRLSCRIIILFGRWVGYGSETVLNSCILQAAVDLKHSQIEAWKAALSDRKTSEFGSDSHV